MKIDKDVLNVLNEAEDDFIVVDNDLVNDNIDSVQLYTYNDPNALDAGLIDDDFTADDPDSADYNTTILDAEKQDVVTIKDKDVIVKDRIPVKLDPKKHSIHFLSPKSRKPILMYDFMLDPTATGMFQIRLADLTKPQIVKFLQSYRFTIDARKKMLAKLTKDELKDLALDLLMALDGFGKFRF